MNRTLYVLTLLCLLLLPPAAEAQPSSPPWLTVEESADVVYFVFTEPARVERYDLQAKTWLSDIGLPAVPTAFAVDHQNLYVSFGRRTSRFNLDGTGEVHLKNTPTDTSGLYVVGNQLVVSSFSGYWSLDKLTGAEVDFFEDFYSITGGDVAVSRRTIFGRTEGVSPSDILFLRLKPDGTFDALDESPYHGDFPDASRVFVFPGDARVGDDAGIIYNTSDLTYSHSLGGRLDDLAFYGDLPVALRDGEVVAYDNAFLETGRHKPVQEPLDIAVHGDTVFAFFQGAGGLEVETFPIGLLEPAEPGEPVDPDGLAYEPDEVILGRDDVVYLLSRAHLSVFRWSVLQRRYLETIPLVEAPTHMAYSAKTHRLYLSYPGGPVRQIRLSESVRETPFVNLPESACALAAAGEYVFSCGSPSNWSDRYIYHPDGSLLSYRDLAYYPAHAIWSEAQRKMYFFSDAVSPSDLMWEEVGPDGTLGDERDSPYHGDIRTLGPINVAPDGSKVVTGSGEIFDPVTLERTDSLSNDVADAAWLGGTLFTVRPLQGQTELQKWGANYGVAAQRQIPGKPLHLFDRRANLLAVTSVDDIPRFTLLDANLNETVPLPALSLAEGRFSVQAVWRTPDGNVGEGHATSLTRDTGYFWFFNSANVEMILKVLDGCGVNGHFWVFAGGLTSVEVEITVIDNVTDQVRTYVNPQGRAFQPIQDTSALACSASAALSSEAAPAAASELLLNNGRFRVEILWETASGGGSGTPVQLTSDTGYFWFFNPSNVEVVVKVLDGCALNGRYWVFAGGLTDVETQLRVTDTLTGAQRVYTNPQGQPFLPLQDTGAFANCL